MKKLITLTTLGLSLSAFAGLPQGKFTGEATTKVKGTAGTAKVKIALVAQGDMLTVTATQASGEVEKHSMKFTFDAGDFFTVTGDDVERGGGYCFGDVCSFGVKSKNGYSSGTWKVDGSGLGYTGSHYDEATKKAEACIAELKKS